MIGAMLGAVVARHPRRTALVFGTRRLSYATLDARVRRLAAALQVLGVRRGDRVATLLHNCNVFVETYFACAALGAVFVPLNFRLRAREIAPMLERCTPLVLLASHAFDDTLAELAGAPGLPAHLLRPDDRPPDGAAADEDAFEAWLCAHAPCEPEPVADADTPHMLVHSSGTTGSPKIAVWTHGTTLASAAAKIIDFGLTETDTTVVFGPLFHVGPLMDLAMPLLLRGGTLVVGASRQFDPRVALRTVERERVTVVTIYPTLWRRVLAEVGTGEFDLSSLRGLFTGGEHMPVPVLREVHRLLPHAGFINTYGSTEGGPITTFLAAEDAQRKAGSVGKPAFGVQVRIADDAGRELARGEVGELLVQSPFVCRGYWGQPQATADSVRDGWWRTGDLGRYDEEGFIWLAGRSKDMIISGAENIYPIEVERVIAAMPGVQEVSVVGVPDDDWGESVAAFVVPTPGAQIDAAAVIAYCRGQLAGYKKPRHVRFVETLPRTTTSKVAKNELRRVFAAAGGATGPV